jgi:hypothetical protein
LVLALLAAGFVELGLRPWIAHGAASLTGLVLVGALALFAKTKLSPSNFALRHTAEEIKRDADAAKRAL